MDFQILAPGFVATALIDGLDVPCSCLTVAQVQRVVRASLTQLGHWRLPGELPTTAGTFLHEISRRISAWSIQQVPGGLTRVISNKVLSIN